MKYFNIRNFYSQNVISYRVLITLVTTNQIDKVVDVRPHRQNDGIVPGRAADEEAQPAEKVVKFGGRKNKQRVSTVNLKKMKI